jgi:hypothetical protein
MINEEICDCGGKTTDFVAETDDERDIVYYGKKCLECNKKCY